MRAPKTVIQITGDLRTSTERATPFQFSAPDLAAAAGIVVATTLLLGFRNDRCYLEVTAFLVDGNKSQVRRSNVLRAVGNVIFNEDFHSDFHGAMKYTVDGRSENDEIAHPHGDQEIDMVDGGGDDVIARVPVGGHRACEVNPVHEASTEKGSQGIGIVWQDDFRHLRLRVANWTRGQIVVCHGFPIGPQTFFCRYDVRKHSAIFCIRKSSWVRTQVDWARSNSSSPSLCGR